MTTQKTIPHCRQCGTCCKKGGPALHLHDESLITGGKIPLAHLVTMRKDEPVFDNVISQMTFASSDIIKIKGIGGQNACRYYNGLQNCSIYKIRPLECRVLSCWNTAPLEEMYSEMRLTRKNLIGQIPGLWDLVSSHQETCGYKMLAKLAHSYIKNSGSRDADEIAQTVRFDMEIRRLTIERGERNTDVELFLFGEPLQNTLPRLGLDIKIHETGIQIKPKKDRYNTMLRIEMFKNAMP